MVRARSPYADAAAFPPGTEPVPIHSLVSGGETFELEVGPGRGGFLFERAAAAPGACIVGLEIRRKWASIVDTRLLRAGLHPRVRVYAEDAKWALARLGPDACLARVYFHFPDPWWKKRHEKRLVLGEPMLNELARLLAPKGEIFFQTDVEERAEGAATLFSSDTRFVPAGDGPGPWLSDNPYGARSPREHRAIQDGLPVFRLRFVRTG